MVRRVGSRGASRAGRQAFIGGGGAVSAFGVGAETLLEAVFAGRSGLRPLERLAGARVQTTIAGEVPADVLADAGGAAALPLHMASLAAREALAGVDARPARAGLGLVLSTTKGDISGVWGEGVGLGIPWRLAEELARALGIGGRVAAVSTACASGLSALALAARWLRAGRLERVLVVGVDALSEFILRGFGGLLALDPGRCRPFDRRRRGLSLGEGAGAILLSAHREESLGVELVGWGESNDARHITAPSPDGRGLTLAARRALERAGLDRSAVDYIQLHGTGTRYNDGAEAIALARLFGGSTAAASGSKAQTGHTLGATGVIESLVAIEALRRATAPGNVGLVETDVHPDLTLVESRRPLERARVALKVCAGFGGINVALAFRR
jgi:3-oxoacyl-(acyl-carrier-protein) synthase